MAYPRKHLPKPRLTMRYLNNLNSNTAGVLKNKTENFIYNGSNNVLKLTNIVQKVIILEINGLMEDEHRGFEITGPQEVTLLGNPLVGSKISVDYSY